MSDSYEKAEYLRPDSLGEQRYNVATTEGDSMGDVYETMDEQPLNGSVMENVAAMAKALKDAEADVEEADSILKAAKERYRVLTQETIPQYYKSLGISKLTLETGEEVSVEEKLTCSQVKDEARLKEAYRWLDAHDGAYLIKKKLEVEELNAAFTDDLKKLGYVEGKDFEVKEAVNTASLKSYLSEKLGRKSAVASIQVADVPSAFGLYIFNEVKIKDGKK